jgi:hypothetical protein
MGKRSDHRSGGRCEPLIKLEPRAFGISATGSTRANSVGLSTGGTPKRSEPSDLAPRADSLRIWKKVREV